MKKLIRIIIIIVIVAAAIVGYSIYKKSKSKPEWRLDTISYGNIREEVTASGTLNPFTLVNVGTEISGKISKIYKDFNSNVKKGEVLAKLDTENLESSLESAQTDVKRAQTAVNDAKLDLDLQQELYQKNMGTSYDYQKAQNKYDQAVQALANSRFALNRNEKNLQNAIITSPIDGVIVSRSVDEGQTVAASLNAPTLFVIANNLKQMQIDAAIDEADIGRIRIGMPVEFTVDAFADENFEGKVKQVRLSPKTDQNVVTYSVIIDVQNPQLKLLPGMTANVTIIIRQMDNVLQVPESALRFKPTKELWKLFGLKWDDKLTARPGRRGGGQSAGMGGNSAGASQKSSMGGNGYKHGNKPAMPESLKAKFAKMSPEQKAAFKAKMQKGGGRPDLSKFTPEQIAAFKKKHQQGETQSSDTQISFAAETQAKIKENKGRVWVLKDGKPMTIDIVTGLSDGNYAEIISGVKEGQEVIIGVNYKNAKQAAASTASPFGGTGGGMGRGH